MDVVDALNTTTMRREESVLKQSVASEVLQILHQQERKLSNLTDTSILGSNRTSSSVNNCQQTKLIVDQLCEHLSGIDALDLTSLNAVRSTIRELSDKLSSAEIVILYSNLQEVVHKQQERRRQLEKELESLAQEVTSLKQLLSTLPETCNGM